MAVEHGASKRYEIRKLLQRNTRKIEKQIKGFEDILKEYNIQDSEGVLECEELWNINNGVTLCGKCHQRVHSPYVKSFRYKGYSVLTSYKIYYVK